MWEVACDVLLLTLSFLFAYRLGYHRGALSVEQKWVECEIEAFNEKMKAQAKEWRDR